MKILVTNDDGIAAPGLWLMVKELQRAGEVTVVAPHQERSGAGTSITLNRPIRVTRAEPQVDGVAAYAVEGTPSDGVIIAVKSLFPGKMDLVVSGINRGPNVGHDVFVSGTVGAALQGYLHGITCMAVSVNAYEALNFAVGARLAGLLAARIRDEVLPRGIMLNVNVPNLDISEVGGVDITTLSRENYCDVVERDESSEDECYRIKRSRDSFQSNADSDTQALYLNRISITALSDGPASASAQNRLKALAPALYGELRQGI